MRHFIPQIIISVGLLGCSTTPARQDYGNFLQQAATEQSRAMANDAAKKLAALYPPATTRFNLRQTTPDDFGASLIAALRARGFAMAELKTGSVATTAQPKTSSEPAPSSDLALAYLVDQPLDNGTYRVSLHVDKQTLSRLYLEKGGAAAPAGQWIRKE